MNEYQQFYRRRSIKNGSEIFHKYYVYIIFKRTRNNIHKIVPPELKTQRKTANKNWIRIFLYSINYFKPTSTKTVLPKTGMLNIRKTFQVSAQGVDMFTMQSARYHMLTTKFKLKVLSVRAPKDVREADDSYFRWFQITGMGESFSRMG